MALKWGIASSGTIANDFVLSLRVYPKSDHIVTAVAARSLDSATEFAKKMDIPNAYEGYEKLGDDPNVDVVYVAVINPIHYEVTKMLLEKGKNVLCEKPLTLNEKQTRRLIDIAKEKKLFLMEGLWLRCFPSFREIKRLVDAGEIGEVMHIYTQIGVTRMHEDRIRMKELGGGITLTVGIYLLAFQQFILRDLKPIKFVANGHLNEHGVDNTVTAVTTYSDNKIAVASVSGLAPIDFEGTIYGTKGVIKAVLSSPTSFSVNGVNKELPSLTNPNLDKYNFKICTGLSYEAEEVRRCLREGRIESPQMTHEDTIEVASLLDKVKAELGIVYDADSMNY